MQRTPQRLRDDLSAVWRAGVAGVRVDRLIRSVVSLDAANASLRVGGKAFPFSDIKRIVVIGGGKASGAMAETLESILEPLASRIDRTGIVNVPDDCLRPLRNIRLHPARPMGVNEPTEAAVQGTEGMLHLVRSLGPKDLCFCLISGGGSALLPAPVEAVPLKDKLELTRFLSETGATIRELNCVRKQISRIKGGGLKALGRGKRMIGLILSDVLGDPLDVIASGPTVESRSSAAAALDVLRKYAPGIDADEPAGEATSGAPDASRRDALKRIARFLRQRIDGKNATPDSADASKPVTRPESRNDDGPEFDPEGGFVWNIIVGNLALAVDAAGDEALRRGYSPALHVARQSEGTAEELGKHLADLAVDMLRSGPDCLIHGGEPIVRLAPANIRGKGGRNQQLVLAALLRLLERLNAPAPGAPLPGIAILSGGTDGEDGPTDAAGAWIDPIFLQRFRDEIRRRPELDPADFLRRNDAYRFFEPFGTLLKTGPTGTNVCDLRVVLVSRDPIEPGTSVPGK